jgi:hypothetical protein
MDVKFYKNFDQNIFKKIHEEFWDSQHQGKVLGKFARDEERIKTLNTLFPQTDVYGPVLDTTETRLGKSRAGKIGISKFKYYFRKLAYSMDINVAYECGGCGTVLGRPLIESKGILFKNKSSGKDESVTGVIYKCASCEGVIYDSIEFSNLKI